MTETGWNMVLNKITTIPVEIPGRQMIAIEAKAWMDGYLKAQTDILELIEEIIKGQKD